MFGYCVYQKRLTCWFYDQIEIAKRNMLSLSEEPFTEKFYVYCKVYILGLIGDVLMSSKQAIKYTLCT